MNYFDSIMSNSTNKVVHFDEKGDNLCIRLQGRSQSIYVMQIDCQILSTCAFTAGKSY